MTAELEAWCFQQLGREPSGQRDNQPRANRRVSNAKLQALGFRFGTRVSVRATYKPETSPHIAWLSVVHESGASD